MENITSLHHYPFGPSSCIVEDRSTLPVLVFLCHVAQKRLEPAWASGIWRCFMYLQEHINSELEASPCCRSANFGNTNTTGLRMQLASSIYSWWSHWFGKHIKGCIWTIQDSWILSFSGLCVWAIVKLVSQRLMCDSFTRNQILYNEAVSICVTKTEPICTDTNCAQTDKRKRQITMQDQVEKGPKLKEFHPWDAYHCYCHHQHHKVRVFISNTFCWTISTNSDAMPIAVMLVFLVTCMFKKNLNSKII